MRSGSGMGIHLVVALIILSRWELKVQASNTALNRPPSGYVLLTQSPSTLPLPPTLVTGPHRSCVIQHLSKFQRTYVKYFVNLIYV